MPHEIRSITQVGTSEPFELQVSRGQITLHYKVHKFGFNPLVQDSEETIWDVGGDICYLPFFCCMTDRYQHDGANDDGCSSHIQGLDANYNELSETVTLDGSGVADNNRFLSCVCFRAFIAGSQEPWHYKQTQRLYHICS